MSVLSYRRAESSDWPLVISSWSQSYRTSHAAGLIPMPLWDDVMDASIRWVLARPGVEVWVAFKPGEDDRRLDLYGWIAVERGFSETTRSRKRVDGRLLWVEELTPSLAPLVHYVFVKLPYRHNGVARGLFKAAGVDPAERFLFTCKTGLVSKFTTKTPHAQWAPLIARHPKDEVRPL